MTLNMKKNGKNSKIGNVIGIFVLVLAAVFLSVGASVLFVDIAGVFCASAASALFACLLFLAGPVPVCLCVSALSAAASFSAAYLVCGDIVNALAGLVYIAVGAFVFAGVKNKWPRTRITVGAICLLSLFHAGLVVLYFFLKTGGFSIGMVSLALDAGLGEGAEFVTGRVAAFSELSEAERAAYVKELVANTKAMTPALFVLYNALAAYLATSFFRFAYNIFIPMAIPGRKKIKNKYWRLDISFVSAVTAALAIVASPFASSRTDPMPAIILTNLIYILAPGFCIVGLYFVHDRVFNERTGVFAVVSAVCALVSVLVFPVALPVFAFVLIVVGLYTTLAGDMRKFFEKAKKNLFDDTDDDDYID